MSAVFTVIPALAVVLALAYGGLALLRRLRPALGSGATLEFVSALQLGPRERVAIVRWRGELLLLGVAAGTVTLIAQQADDPVGDGPSATGATDRRPQPGVFASLERGAGPIRAAVRRAGGPPAPRA